MFDKICQTLYFWQIITVSLHKVHPFRPAFFADVRSCQILHFPVSGHSRHPAQPGRIAVLLINGQAFFLQIVIEIIDSFIVFVRILCIDLDNSMEGFSAGIDQCRYRKLQSAVHCILFRNRHRIGFDQGIPESSHVFILNAFSIERIEADPCTGFRFPVTDRPGNVIRMLLQRCDHVFGGSGINSLGR